jgi:hypothetical protein
MNLQDYPDQITQLFGAKIINNQMGANYVGSTSQQNGEWQAIQAITDTKFHTLTGNITGLANTDSAIAITVPAGLAIYGKFTRFQLHSGSVLAYLN